MIGELVYKFSYGRRTSTFRKESSRFVGLVSMLNPQRDGYPGGLLLFREVELDEKALRMTGSNGCSSNYFLFFMAN